MTQKTENLAENPFSDDEAVNHPSHYNAGTIECIDYIEDQGLGYHAGCAVKYLARYRFKGTPVRDLRKAAWYCLRLADQIEAKLHLSTASLQEGLRWQAVSRKSFEPDQRENE